MLAGIDYGSKLAGTTVIATVEQRKVLLLQSRKGEDADQMILSKVAGLTTIYLDAPLSLPRIYSQPQDEDPDYFYREGDKIVGAMSPMFLGGLTARAMKLSAQLKQAGTTCYESYPGKRAKLLGWTEKGYKKEKNQLEPLAEILLAQMDLSMETLPANWHQLDALLFLSIGLDHQHGVARQAGDPQEGIILY
jgi:predicted nuclease with RNAse H fold